MNFFGHAAVACRYSIQSGFVLGAMLPDFASMLRVRPPSPTAPDIESGVRFHHRTDDVFHGCPTFVSLSRQAGSWLSGAGLRRGTARAVAHVGVEILLDSALCTDGASRAAYCAALSWAEPHALGISIGWTSDETGMRFDQLRQLLLERAQNEAEFGSAATEVVCLRLERALAGRPRLAFDAEARGTVAEWVERTRPRVFEETPELLAQVLAGLDAAHQIAAPAR